ncbi:lysophospholipase L1-like esterase [Actinomadura pelletieri DSM 43383]|uniref:Lysophospholipase L1-like esterase n=1 Tax=Actinomadura pelletieri DSM 43383 TaxID=1120940 RepID=A0A495QJ33_9ACTN|nr:GDSL-type esterase/lipase family protein [Actinomadura pelletieri]RKS72148.1 lysophospholipase L1-like esterase [Actinomadura pelletieri DSM 43383]
MDLASTGARAAGTGPEPVMVVLGDSVAEGQADPDPGGGWLGWAGRLACHLGISRAELLNVADPGATIEDVVRDQLPAVRRLRPRLLVLGCGMNDALRGFDRTEVAARLDELFGWARDVGAVAVAIPVPRPPLLDLSPISQFRKKRTVQRISDLNDELGRAAREFGTTFPEREAVAKVADPAMWNADGIHLNPRGHAYVAEVIGHIAGSSLGERVR